MQEGHALAMYLQRKTTDGDARDEMILQSWRTVGPYLKGSGGPGNSAASAWPTIRGISSHLSFVPDVCFPRLQVWCEHDSMTKHCAV
eukprot:809867-Amphidinium_carterae.1